MLPPPGTSPHVLAAVLKKFLITLPEPLLTFKYVDAVVTGGFDENTHPFHHCRLLPDFLATHDEPHNALAVMPKLPQVCC